MKKHIILSLLIIGTFMSASIAQTQYFYEFSVPGLTSKTDASTITSIINELGVSNPRVSEISGKVVFLSDNIITAQTFSEKLNEKNYYLFFFNSGVQGVDKHFNKSIKEWNVINASQATEKVFVAIGTNSFNQNQKDAIKIILENENDFTSLSY